MKGDVYNYFLFVHLHNEQGMSFDKQNSITGPKFSSGNQSPRARDCEGTGGEGQAEAEGREERWSRCLETGAILGNLRDPGGLGEGPWGKLSPSTPTRLAFPTAEPNPPGCLHPLNLAPEACGPGSTGTHTALTRGGWGWARGR